MKTFISTHAYTYYCGETTGSHLFSTHTHDTMTEKKQKPKCPQCGGGNTYMLVSGKLVCRDCGYDERKVDKV